MANNENLIPIPGRLHSVATEGHVAGADEIYDDTLSKDQATINSESAYLEDASSTAVIPSFDPQADSLHKSAQVLSAAEKAQVKQNLGIDGDLSNLNNSILAEATARANAVSAEQSRAQAAESSLSSGKADKATTLSGYGITDAYTKTETYTKTEVNNLITTPNQEYVTVTATNQTTAVTDVLPATGEADTVYRVGNWDGTQYNDSVFSEYAWNGSAYIKLSTKSQIGEVYDISANHADTKYADLAAALGTNGANIPQSLRKGGMSVKYVQTSDNKYVQYFLTKNTWSVSEADWEKVNLKEEVGQLGQKVFDLLAKYIVVKQNQKIAGDGLCRFYQDNYVNPDGTLSAFNGSYATYYIPVKPEASYHYRNGRLQAGATIAFYDGEKNFVSSLGSFDDVEIDYDFTVPANCYYLRASKLVGGIGDFYISSAQDYEIEYDAFLFEWLKDLQDNLLLKSGTIIQKDEDNTYKDGYYLNEDGGESYFGAPYKYTENYIPVFGNVHYKYEGTMNSSASICFYDINKNLISSIHPGSDTWYEHEFLTPESCAYIRCTTMTTCNIYLSEDIVSNKITQWVISLFGQNGILYQPNSLVAPDKQNTYKEGYYLNSLGGESYFGSPYRYTENYIFVIPNSKYKYSGLVNSQASIVFYDKNKNYIGAIYPGSDTWYEHEFNTPANCFYIRCTTMSTCDIYCLEVLMGELFNKEIENVVSALNDGGNIEELDYGKSLVGDVDITNIKKYDYAHIIYYGQSLSCGVDTPSALTTTPISGCYMIGDSLEDFGSGTTKNPLVNVQSEHPVVATVNAFARLYRQFVEPQKDFFGSSCGIGGATITELSKGGTLYDNRFINQIDRIQTCVFGEGKTIACPAIVYLQGENDVNPGFTPKDTYKALMLQLKNDMQADIMAKYGQTEKPMFFIYSVSNQFNSQPGMNIPMAQIEFAAENEDVFLLNPYYSMPSYDRCHMSENGYRWYGSLAAKSIFDVIVKCRDYSTIVPKKFELLGKKELLVRFYVPVEPLVFDSAIIPDAGNNYGFALFLNSTRLDLNKIELYDSNSIKITTYEDIDSGTLEIYYAMAGSIGWGTGNLRDSDAFKAYYNYVDDTNERSVNNTDIYYRPTQLYGKKYPLYNWCSPFYYLIRS